MPVPYFPPFPPGGPTPNPGYPPFFTSTPTPSGGINVVSGGGPMSGFMPGGQDELFKLLLERIKQQPAKPPVAPGARNELASQKQAMAMQKYRDEQEKSQDAHRQVPQYQDTRNQMWVTYPSGPGTVGGPMYSKTPSPNGVPVMVPGQLPDNVAMGQIGESRASLPYAIPQGPQEINSGGTGNEFAKEMLLSALWGGVDRRR